MDCSLGRVPLWICVPVGNGGVGALVIADGGLEDEAEGAVVIEERLHPGAIRSPFLFVLEPPDLRGGVAGHFA